MRKFYFILAAAMIFILMLNFSSSESGLVVFQNSTVNFSTTPQYEPWDETNFSIKLNATNVQGTIRWQVLKNNPVRQEVILGTLDANSDLKIQFYNSSGNFTPLYNLTLSSGVTIYRSFDIAVEGVSGDVIVAFNNGTAGLFEYRIWNGTEWYDNGSARINTTSQINWIKFASNPYNNNLMLLAANSSNGLDSFFWNGTNFSAANRLETSIETGAKECFDVEFENSGEVLIVWANSSLATPRYVVYSNNNYSTVANAPASSGQTATFQWIRLKNYPNTDRIMMCATDSDADLNCAEWAGSAWGSVSEITAAGEYANGSSFRNFDIIPDTSSGSFFLMFGNNNLDYYPSARCFGQSNCQLGSWETTQTFLSGVDLGTDTAWSQLDYDPENAGKITAIMTDQTRNEFRARISCSNSSNSCSADQSSVFLGNSSNVSFESAMFVYQGIKPSLTNISAASTIQPSSLMTITVNGEDDLNSNSLNLYCSYSSPPDSSNSICTGGNITQVPPYSMTCTFTSQASEGNHTTYCRIYDGNYYSSTANLTYSVDESVPLTSVLNVEGDTSASYFDKVNNLQTEINISGESGMTCRWSTSDQAYSTMSSACTTSGTEANCVINDGAVAGEGYKLRYISCADSGGNGQNSSQNLDIAFYVDYNAPTTSDNSDTDIHVPNYFVNITEGDVVDSDPTTYYCVDTSNSCTPLTSIDNHGSIVFTSSNRGANYLRYYSVDDAGNTQSVQSKTININQLPTFTSASDDASVIKGGTAVNVSTVSVDSDAQDMSLFVCSALGANSSGCTSSTYCNSTGSVNLSCNFSSESDSSLHIWYAYIFDSSNEASSGNPKTGYYTTDSASPAITVSSPSSTTYTQNSLTFSIVVNEPLTNAFYSINSEANVSLSNISLYEYTHTNSSIGNGNYNISFYANDSYGNLANISVSFVVDSSSGDTTPPSISILHIQNSSYSSASAISLNITSNENISSAWYILDSGSAVNMTNFSELNFSANVTLTEGYHNITVYANDSSNNIGNKSVVIITDLTNPQVTLSCPASANDSNYVICNYTLSDSIGLSYIVLSHNSSSSWANSSNISLAANVSYYSNYSIIPANTTMPSFVVIAYAYDLAGRINSSSYNVTITDDTFPLIQNFSYYPNSTDDLDPLVDIVFNVSVIENYLISSVSLMYRNSTLSDWSSIAMSNDSSRGYNVSLSFQNGTWEVKVNATDAAGNANFSSSYSLVISNDTSISNSTNLADITSFNYAQRNSSNNLGWIFINNTADSSITLNVSITSSIRDRFNVNYTSSANASYSLDSKSAVNLTMLVNTTGLSGLYNFNITLTSEAGTTTVEKKLNIQTSAAGYLVTVIDVYTSSVTKGQAEINLSAKVTNLGSLDATEVYLNWSLPSEFTVTSGSASRSIGSLPIGSSGRNSISISVSSDSVDKFVDITAIATSSNADSSNDTKQISIGSPVSTVVERVVSSAGGGTGGSGVYVAPKPKEYSNTIEILKGNTGEIEIEVENTYANRTLEDLKLSIGGYMAQYITISPLKISSLKYKEKAKFKVKFNIPTYKNYEEYELTAVISGFLSNMYNVKESYEETRNIKLIVQDVSLNEVDLKLKQAEEAIDLMKKNGFNVDSVENLLANAKKDIGSKNNKDALKLAAEIISIKEKAFKVKSLMDRLQSASEDPKKLWSLTAMAVDEKPSKLSSLAKKLIYSNSKIGELLELANIAFERGDYDLAEERLKSVQTLIMLEKKGNVALFVYLYWPIILISLVLFVFGGFASYRVYQKESISGRIKYLLNEEDGLTKLIQHNQENYFKNKMNHSDYTRSLSQYQERISKIRKERITLRNKRINLLSPEHVLKDLEKEKNSLETEIKKLQDHYYVHKTIPEESYKMQFKSMQERLAEIEDEKLTISLSKKHKHFKGKWLNVRAA